MIGSAADLVKLVQIDEMKSAKRSRTVYLLPNLFTTASLFAGFYAVIAAANGHFVPASIAIFIAGAMDGLDGRVARLTGTSSEFGVQYDSLADLISFGMAPALVMYHWSLSALKHDSAMMGRLGWGAAFLYVACAALRLARFNIQTTIVDKRWFVGLSSPAAAGLMMAFVWSFADESNDHAGIKLRYVALAVTVASGLLMISRFLFWSFKGGRTGPNADRIPYLVLTLIPVVLVVLVIDLPRALLALAGIYVSSGPLLWLWRLRGRSTDSSV